MKHSGSAYLDVIAPSKRNSGSEAPNFAKFRLDTGTPSPRPGNTNNAQMDISEVTGGCLVVSGRSLGAMESGGRALRA